MKVNKAIVLALTGLILAVSAIGTANALTWNGQTDVSQLISTAQWYFAIGDTGTATVGYKVSWGNGFNNLCCLPVKPNLIWEENMDGLGWDTHSQLYYSTLSMYQAWSINEYTIDVLSASGANNIDVTHEYRDDTGTVPYGRTYPNTQYYTW